MTLIATAAWCPRKVMLDVTMSYSTEQTAVEVEGEPSELRAADARVHGCSAQHCKPHLRPGKRRS